MLVPFDNNVPRSLARSLQNHSVTEARELGWATLRNGDLIDAAEKGGFHVLITADKNMRYQQNFTRRVIALVVLTEQRWTMVRRRLVQIADAVDSAAPGSYTEVEVPYR